MQIHTKPAHTYYLFMIHFNSILLLSLIFVSSVCLKYYKYNFRKYRIKDYENKIIQKADFMGVNRYHLRRSKDFDYKWLFWSSGLQCRAGL
jgi:hypothetical protein